MTAGGHTESFNSLRSPARGWLRLLQSAVLAGLLLIIPLGAPASRAIPAPSNGAHVYMLRGLLNIFSLGLDDIATKLEAQGIPVTSLSDTRRAPLSCLTSWKSLTGSALR
jgi:hypothetical protein